MPRPIIIQSCYQIINDFINKAYRPTCKSINAEADQCQDQEMNSEDTQFYSLIVELLTRNSSCLQIHPFVGVEFTTILGAYQNQDLYGQGQNLHGCIF